jgi:hypothetical protein
MFPDFVVTGERKEWEATSGEGQVSFAIAMPSQTPGITDAQPLPPSVSPDQVA